MSTLESMFTTRSAVKENLNGHLEITTKVNTKMMKEMAMAKWLGLMVVNTLANG